MSTLPEQPDDGNEELTPIDTSCGEFDVPTFPAVSCFPFEQPACPSFCDFLDSREIRTYLGYAVDITAVCDTNYFIIANGT